MQSGFILQLYPDSDRSVEYEYPHIRVRDNLTVIERMYHDRHYLLLARIFPPDKHCRSMVR
ncbi:hypothetical protein [Chamaesiphon sp. VAR_48_metabat_135_sub]|uniref:hypothetical protein n=1 Tax=Chamaesiphon sp. VAR_48_metabat_135_sub TaxID=2964699 RepID=UPI00286C8241|nr:hypothetical protein [Chamaesiphon sp. VAR_48_metabat_135_sub]